MNRWLRNLLAEMIDTVAVHNPGLARAWHKLLEASCSDDCSSTSTASSHTSSSPPSHTPLASSPPTSRSADSPPPVPDAIEQAAISVGTMLFCFDSVWDFGSKALSSEAADKINSGLTALRANRDWWRKRAEHLESLFQDQCHNSITDDVQRFCDGCEKYQVEKFGRSPITTLRARIRDLESKLTATTQARDSAEAENAELRRRCDRQMAEIDRMRRETHPMLEKIHEFETGMADLRQSLKRQMNKPPTIKEIHALGLQEPDTTTPPSVTAGAEVREGVEYASVNPAFSDYRWVAKDGYVDVKFKNKCWGPSTFTLEAFAAYIARGELVPVPPEVKP